MRTLCLTVFALAFAAMPSLAQKPKPKPPAPALKGTAQLPGDNGKLDQAYTMGKDQPLNFTLRSAAYTLDRLVIGTSIYGPNKEQKLLILKFTAQNPNKSDTLLRYDSFQFMAVDSKDVNHESINAVVKVDENKDGLDLQLKPGQKMEVATAILLPANASVPKLIVQRDEKTRVLRYDLRGLVKPLPPSFTDPADKSGSVVAQDVAGDKVSFFPGEHFDLKFVSAAAGPEKMGDQECSDGKQFYIVTVTLRNTTNTKQLYRYDTLHARIISADGEKEEPESNLLFKTSRDEQVDSELPPGETYTCRLVLSIAKSSKPAKIILSEGDSHGFIFDLTPSP